MTHTHRFSIATAAITLFSTIVGLNLIGLKSAQAVTLNTNLIVNGDAELGTAAALSIYDVVTEVPGWTTTNTFSVYQYGFDDIFPAATSPGPDVRGDNFFGGGSILHSLGIRTPSPTINRSFDSSASLSSAFQTIDLSSDGLTIDEGDISFNLSGFFGGYSIKPDAATLVADFLDTNNAILSSASIGSVTNFDRGNTTGLLERDTTGSVPVGTRSILVTLNMNAPVVSNAPNSYDNHAYADNLGLVLAKNPKRLPEPSEVPGVLIASGLTIGAIVKRRQKSS